MVTQLPATNCGTKLAPFTTPVMLGSDGLAVAMRLNVTGLSPLTDALTVTGPGVLLSVACVLAWPLASVCADVGLTVAPSALKLTIALGTPLRCESTTPTTRVTGKGVPAAPL